MQQKSSRDSIQSETMTKAVGAALVPEILAQSLPAVKVGAGVFVSEGEPHWRTVRVLSVARTIVVLLWSQCL